MLQVAENPCICSSRRALISHSVPREACATCILQLCAHWQLALLRARWLSLAGQCPARNDMHVSIGCNRGTKMRCTDSQTPRTIDDE